MKCKKCKQSYCEGTEGDVIHHDTTCELVYKLNIATDALAFYACMKHVAGIQVSPNPDCSGAYVCTEDYSGKIAEESLQKIKNIDSFW